MGRPKQTLRHGDESLLRRAALAAFGAGCFPVVVVTGANAELSRQELDGLDVREVFNPEWQSGLASSVRAGIERVFEPGGSSTAAVLMLCDQPHVTAEVISRLMEAHRDSGSAVVASTYGGSRGVPALFGRSLAGELTALAGAAGAKQVIERHAAEAYFVAFDGGEIDVDTPDDFARLVAASGDSAG